MDVFNLSNFKQLEYDFYGQDIERPLTLQFKIAVATHVINK